MKVIPMTAYHNVSEVRTNDDTLITIKLMLFFDLVDIERMLDATVRPQQVNGGSQQVTAGRGTSSACSTPPASNAK